MTKRVCQVCGNRKHIDTMKKVGTRYACNGLTSSCVKKAKAEIKMQQSMRSPKAGKSIFKMFFYFLGFIIGGNVLASSLADFLESFGVDFSTANSVSLLPSFILLGAAVILYKKYQNKEE